jgi:hemerythrin
MVDEIKRDLYKRGYNYDHFLTLDNRMQQGSRQLLVCVGWLIYHIKLIDKCMKQCLNSLSNLNEVCYILIKTYLSHFCLITDK